MTTLFVAATILAALLGQAAPVHAQTAQSDPVLAGYMRFYAGNAESAQQYFQTLRNHEPHSLAGWFGLLFA